MVPLVAEYDKTDDIAFGKLLSIIGVQPDLRFKDC